MLPHEHGALQPTLKQASKYNTIWKKKGHTYKPLLDNAKGYAIPIILM
jgi:hypothetical protein